MEPKQPIIATPKSGRSWQTLQRGRFSFIHKPHLSAGGGAANITADRHDPQRAANVCTRVGTRIAGVPPGPGHHAAVKNVRAQTSMIRLVGVVGCLTRPGVQHGS